MQRRADVATLGTGRVVYVRGTPYQQGRQLGEAAADLIRENVQRATELCHSVAAGFDLSAYTAMTRRNERWVERVYPELLEELHGVAETSGVAYEDLLHLNLTPTWRTRVPTPWCWTARKWSPPARRPSTARRTLPKHAI